MAKRPDNPDEIVHLQVRPGGTALWRDHAYGDRGTLQIRRGDRGQVDGPVDELPDGNAVPDVGDRPAAASP